MGDDELSHLKLNLLLEASACNDLPGFKSLVEEEGLQSIDASGLWYGRRLGSKKMGFEERTPLMIAALFGSKEIVDYIMSTGLVDVNRSCGSDGATALHCAVSGLSANSHEVVNLLLKGSADPDYCDAYGNKPGDLIFPCLSPVFGARKKVLERLLRGTDDLTEVNEQEEGGVENLEIEVSSLPHGGSERKEYPVDPTLPDIKNGIYGTDEFRMYAFKIKPCSRAYSHDWTECPFVHPGENARRRDPRKYHYSCVPCPEFRKGSCSRGDNCEYAHGIFECWLHPAQYRTRLCKDETNCARRVCFFAHKPEELRPLYPSTGSGVPSPRSSFSSTNSFSAFDMAPISPIPIGASTTPPLSPNGVSSPGKTWMNWPNTTPPALQLPGSRLKSALNAREIGFCEEIQSLSSPTRWNNNTPMSASSSPFSGKGMNRLAGGAMSPVNNLTDIFGTEDIKSGLQIRHSALHSNSLSSSPVGANSLFSRAAQFANQRSQSFIERSNGRNHHNPTISSMTTPCLNDWGALDGKLDWSIQGDELHKFRKSTSFCIRSGGMESRLCNERTDLEEPDVSWVDPLVKEPQETRLPPVWMEQSYMETEQTVA